VIATLFDFDGVLVDSELAHLAAFNDVLKGRGIAIDEREYVSRYLSLDDAGVFKAVLTLRGHTMPSEHELRALVAAKNPRFMARFANSVRIFPGAAELVTRRAARALVGVVSGALAGEIEFGLLRMGVRDRVPIVVSAERTRAKKPDPEGYLLAVSELRAMGHLGPVVVIEDSIGGIAAAKAARLACVAVAHSYRRDLLVRAGADAVTDNLAALTDELLDGVAR
jgi:beta-phosphoglucomutase-like phosphatase (HAD superfamily)